MQRVRRSPFPTQGLVVNDIGLRDVSPDPASGARLLYTSARWPQAWACAQFVGMTLLFGALSWMLLAELLQGGGWFWLTLCLMGFLFCASELGYSVWWLAQSPYRVALDVAAGTWETSEWQGRLDEIVEVDIEGVSRGLGQYWFKVVLKATDKQRVVLGLFPEFNVAERAARSFTAPITLKRVPLHTSRRRDDGSPP